MPAPKSHRVGVRRAARNRPIRTLARTRVVQARAAIEANPGAPETAEAVKVAASALAKAASKGVIHRNAAARRISRLTRRQNAAAAAAGDDD
jgi:small subunit ribosomal protein S20